MTVLWLLDIHGRTGPQHLAIADAISEAVEDGSLPSGAKFPAQTKLAYDLGVTLDTVSLAYQEAIHRGALERGIGHDIWVRGRGFEISAVGGITRADEPWYGTEGETVVPVVLCSAESANQGALVGRAYPSRQAFDRTPKGRRYGEWW
ncbi:MAG: GntR family transcriptional regulator [Magnetovibrio sp.]|nr:GntR family transcriptional regulator [Magnetovibrio sp.]